MMNLQTPMIGMMLLTMIVWFVMYYKRIGYMMRERIRASDASTPEKVAALLPESVNNTANNLKNLFELPVLFYAACLLLITTGQADRFDVYLGYAYVLLRAMHSVVQCTNNRVMTRFKVYALSSLVLWVLLIRLALGMF